MKHLVLPATLLALAAPAHAGIVTSFDVTSAVHWTSQGAGAFPDSEVFTPFGGTFRSSLTPLSACKNTYSKTTHTTSCAFDSDTSGFRSPYESAYLDRLGLSRPNRTSILGVLLKVSKSGAYYANFTFLNGSYIATQEADDTYYTGFRANYQFTFSGTGMDWGTTMDAALADLLWHRQKPGTQTFETLWDKTRFDPVTDVETTLSAEGWNGDIRFRAVPEPTGSALFGVGLIGLAALRRRKA